MKSRHGKCQAGLLVQPSARRRLFPVGFSPVLCWHKVVKRCFICSTAPYLFIVLQNSLWTFSYGEMTSQPCYRIRSLHPVLQPSLSSNATLQPQVWKLVCLCSLVIKPETYLIAVHILLFHEALSSNQQSLDNSPMNNGQNVPVCIKQRSISLPDPLPLCQKLPANKMERKDIACGICQCK